MDSRNQQWPYFDTVNQPTAVETTAPLRPVARQKLRRQEQAAKEPATESHARAAVFAITSNLIEAVEKNGIPTMITIGHATLLMSLLFSS